MKSSHHNPRNQHIPGTCPASRIERWLPMEQILYSLPRSSDIRLRTSKQIALERASNFVTILRRGTAPQSTDFSKGARVQTAHSLGDGPMRLGGVAHARELARTRGPLRPPNHAQDRKRFPERCPVGLAVGRFDVLRIERPEGQQPLALAHAEVVDGVIFKGALHLDLQDLEGKKQCE